MSPSLPFWRLFHIGILLRPSRRSILTFGTEAFCPGNPATSRKDCTFDLFDCLAGAFDLNFDCHVFGQALIRL